MTLNRRVRFKTLKAQLSAWLPGLLLLSLCAAMLVAALMLSRQTRADSTEENPLWAVYQIDRETRRFRHELNLLTYDYSDARLDSATLRFDILYSRVDLIRRGQLKKMLTDQVENTELVERFLPIIMAIDIHIPELASGDLSIVPKLLTHTDELANTAEQLQLKLLKQRAEQRLNERHTEQAYLTLLSGLLLLALGAGAALCLKQRAGRAQQHWPAPEPVTDLPDRSTADEAIHQAEAALLARIDHRIHDPIYDIHDHAALLRLSRLDPEQQRYTRHICQSADNLIEALHALHQQPEREPTNRAEPAAREVTP